MHHGTGDIFCSVLVSALTLGRDTDFALNAAVEFTCLAIENTLDFPKLWYGVNFEGVLNRLPLILGGTDGSAV
jgi:hydroxymethylpyrimidine/phosphomethylpyrimidine kinase